MREIAVAIELLVSMRERERDVTPAVVLLVWESVHKQVAGVRQ